MKFHIGIHRFFFYFVIINIFVLLFLSINILFRGHKDEREKIHLQNDDYDLFFENQSYSIINLKTNGLVNPIGYELGIPSLSWVINTSLDAKLKSTKIEIALDSKFTYILFSNETEIDVSSIDYRVLIPLQSRTRYYWRVTVVVNEDEVLKSGIAFFETGKINEEWDAKWITPEKKMETAFPYVRKVFKLNSEPVSARIYITGLGMYELYVNGKLGTSEHFMPFCNLYATWIQYQTFDITHLLKKGKNVIGVHLGDGWAKARFAFTGEPADMYIKGTETIYTKGLVVDQYYLIAEIYITLANGKTIKIITDKTWKCTSKSEIILSNIYDGEIINTNLAIKGWCDALFDDSNWEKMMETTIDGKRLGKLTARYSPPVTVKETIKPKQIIQTKNGDVILDMGQNMVGWIQFSLNNVPKDFDVILEFAEFMDDGEFYTNNLNTAQQKFRYISDGNSHENIHPHFTFYGFQYVKLTKWYTLNGKLSKDSIDLNDFIGLSIYSDIERRGYLTTSNELVNRFINNSFWSQKDNFLDVPSDCPQRDERLGWTGDAQNYCGTALFNTDCYAFFRKFLNDIFEMQKILSGAVPNFVPDFHQPSEIGSGSCGWADAACIIPWNLYLFTGKRQILEEQINSMKIWVDWIGFHDKYNKSLWIPGGAQFGDWLALDGSDFFGPTGGTNPEFLCSAFYYLSTSILVKSLKILHLDEYANKYEKLRDNILNAIRKTFYDENGNCFIETQTAQVISLQFGLAPENKEKVILSNLIKLLKSNNMHLTTGVIGTPFLCRVLSDFGASDIAYDLFMQTDIPSWLYQAKMGATTTWERWDSVFSDGRINQISMNSLNHYWIGSILEWIYRNVCGIKPMERSPGFKEFKLHPQPSRKLNMANCSYNSPMGLIESSWEYIEDNVIYNFTVPFNTIAHLKIQNVNNTSCKILKGNFHLAQKGNNAVSKLKSGKYSLSCSSSK